MTLYHKHHLKPKHLGGTNVASNLLKVTLDEHILIHEARWYAYNQHEDLIAWKALERMKGKEEQILQKCTEASKRGNAPGVNPGTTGKTWKMRKPRKWRTPKIWGLKKCKNMENINRITLK